VRIVCPKLRLHPALFFPPFQKYKVFFSPPPSSPKASATHTLDHSPLPVYSHTRRTVCDQWYCMNTARSWGDIKNATIVSASVGLACLVLFGLVQSSIKVNPVWSYVSHENLSLKR